jgi:hypothetical protein
MQISAPTSQQAVRQTAVLSVWKVGLVVLGLAFVLYWPLRSQYLYEWDSVQLALGVWQFDIFEHQPHPPGYPLWELALYFLNFLLRDVNLGMVVLSIAFTAAAATTLYALAARDCGKACGLAAAVMLLVTPSVYHYGLIATTYPADLLTSAALGLLAARLWEGQRRLAPWSLVAWGLLAGVRQSGAVMMAPLLAVALVRACRTDWHLWRKSLAAGAIAVGVWLAPLALMHEGLGTYLHLNRCSARTYFKTSSVFYGASAGAHLDMIEKNLVWLYLMLGVPLLGAAAAKFWRRRAGGSEAEATSSADTPAWRRPLFLALWLAPNLLVAFLLHSPKPGYFNVTLPPLLLLLVTGMLRDLSSPETAESGSGVQQGSRTVRRQAIWVAVLAVASVALASVNYRPPPALDLNPLRRATYEASLAEVRAADITMNELRAVITRNESRPGEDLIVPFGGNSGGNSRRMMYYFPEAYVLSAPYHTITRDWSGVPYRGLTPEVHTVWWICNSGDPVSETIREALPATVCALADQYQEIWRTDIGADPIDAEIEVHGGMVHLYRPLGIMDFSNNAVQKYLRGGWGPAASWGRWTIGPSSEMLLPSVTAHPKRLKIMVKSLGRQRVEVEVDKRPVASLEFDDTWRICDVPLPARTSPQTARLVFKFPDARTPLSLHQSDDDRLLGMAVQWMTID